MMENKDLNTGNDTFLAEWLAGDLSDAELKNLVSEADYVAYQKIRQGINTYSALERETDSSFAKIQDRIQNKKAPKVRTLNSNNWWIGIAASLIILFGVFSLLKDDTVTIETNFGEQKTFVLLDGSEVILNSRSTVTYSKDDWTDSRTLSLYGEAYFKVEKGSTFTVNTLNGNVAVLGTQFNVNSNADLFEVVCYEGKVRVASQSETIDLLPSNTVRRINGNALEQWNVSETKPSWINGESNFNSVPLNYVISALEAEYDISINSENINTDTVFTGSFPHDSLTVALQTVFKSLDIQYIEKEKGLIYLSEK